MRAVDFFSLPRAQQDRFLGALSGELGPQPLVTRPIPTRVPTLLGLAGLGGLGALAAMLGAGFGDARSAESSYPPALIGVAAIPAVVAWVAPTLALSLRARRRAMPWQPAHFLFPRDVVDAERTAMRVFSLEEARSITARGRTIEVVFAEARFAFEAESAASASAIVDEIEALRATGRPSLSGEGWQHDPLAMPRVQSPLAPTHPLEPAAPAWTRLAWLFAALVGGMLGPAAAELRNRKSDDAMYAKAVRADRVDDYRAYLAHGLAHRDEVASRLLPRAELRLAEAEGTVEAIERFAASHPNTKIGDEITAAHARAMAAALDAAKKQGTLAALDAFAKAHPNHGLEAELRAAVRAVYDAALAKFKADAGSDPTTVAAAEQLLRWAEAHGPAFEVRVERRPSKTMVNADKFVPRTAMYRGAFSHPSAYFTADKLAADESSMGKGVVDALAAAFPAELCKPTLGATRDEGGASPESKVPVLTITHAEEWGGKAFLSESPRGVFVDVNFVVEARLSFPGEAAPKWSLRTNVLRTFSQQSLVVGKRGSKEQDRVNLFPEEHLYGQMTREAFAAIRAKIVGAWRKNVD
jgi:hypothetical protein